MIFPQQFPSLTIPTGAGPGQQRITINKNQNGAILVYDSTGTLIVSIASAAGTEEGGFNFLPGIAVYTATNSINFLNNAGVWQNNDGSKVDIETGTGSFIFLHPINTGTTVFDAQISTSSGANPGLVLQSPAESTFGFSSTFTLGGSSAGSALTTATLAADRFNANALCHFGNVVVGHTSIVTVANTPTLKTVTYSAILGTSFMGFANYNSSVPGTQVLGISIQNITSTSADIYLTRTNAVSTGVDYMVFAT